MQKKYLCALVPTKILQLTSAPEALEAGIKAVKLSFGEAGCLFY